MLYLKLKMLAMLYLKLKMTSQILGEVFSIQRTIQKYLE